MNKSDPLDLLRKALVPTWLLTAFVSAYEWNGQSLNLLQSAGLDVASSHGLVALGIVVDLAVGLALWLRPGRWSYRAALLAMGGMTLAATALLPRLWLDPLGPLLKNLPIAAVLILLERNAA